MSRQSIGLPLVAVRRVPLLSYVKRSVLKKLKDSLAPVTVNEPPSGFILSNGPNVPPGRQNVRFRGGHPRVIFTGYWNGALLARASFSRT